MEGNRNGSIEPRGQRVEGFETRPGLGCVRRPRHGRRRDRRRARIVRGRDHHRLRQPHPGTGVQQPDGTRVQLETPARRHARPVRDRSRRERMGLELQRVRLQRVGREPFLHAVVRQWENQPEGRSRQGRRQSDRTGQTVGRRHRVRYLRHGQDHRERRRRRRFEGLELGLRR